jgi:Methylmalonyl-CoA mutase, C-terminal domain/subunit (cobalamin-binding)
VGGTIPVEDFPILTEAGVDRIFVPGTPVAEVVDYIVQACEQGRGASSAAGRR